MFLQKDEEKGDSCLCKLKGVVSVGQVHGEEEFAVLKHISMCIQKRARTAMGDVLNHEEARWS